MPFDGLIVAAGDKEVVPEIEELTYESPEDAFLNLRENVFLPTHSKLEH